jgi:hypothetical protein
MRNVRHWSPALLGIATMIGGAGVVWYVNREAIREYLDHHRRVARAAWASSHPVVGELARGTVRPGDPVEGVVSRHPPTHSLTHGRYTTVCYVEGNRETYLVARDGRLVFARQGGHRVHRCTFFATWTRAEEADWGASRERAVAELARHRAAARAAVAGCPLFSADASGDAGNRP